ncbi:MAG: hypothetical protein ACP5MB_06355 [bacterium]
MAKKKKIKGKLVKVKVINFYKHNPKRKTKKPKDYVAGAVAYKLHLHRLGKKVRFNYKGKNRRR